MGRSASATVNRSRVVTPKKVPQQGVHACDVRPLDSMCFQKQVECQCAFGSSTMPIKKPGFALTCQTGVNKGLGFWFAVFLSVWSLQG